MPIEMAILRRPLLPCWNIRRTCILARHWNTDEPFGGSEGMHVSIAITGCQPVARYSLCTKKGLITFLDHDNTVTRGHEEYMLFLTRVFRISTVPSIVAISFTGRSEDRMVEKLSLVIETRSPYLTTEIFCAHYVYKSIVTA